MQGFTLSSHELYYSLRSQTWKYIVGWQYDAKNSELLSLKVASRKSKTKLLLENREAELELLKVCIERMIKVWFISSAGKFVHGTWHAPLVLFNRVCVHVHFHLYSELGDEIKHRWLFIKHRRVPMCCSKAHLKV